MDRNEEVAYLVAQVGPLNGQRWEVNQRLVLGRDPDSHVVIPDRQVSRHHAQLIPTIQGVTLEDLNSKNGVHHNGKRLLEPVYLQDGDVIQIALAQQFVFLSSDATLPLEGDFNGLVPTFAGAEAYAPGRSGTYQSRTRPRGDGRLYLEKRSRRVWVGSSEVDPPLSVSQFKLLELLFDNQGRVVPRQTLITTVWGDVQAIAISEQALDALVRRLRDRLSSLDPDHNYIVTVRGHGLRLDNPPS